MNNPFDYKPDAECDEAFRNLTDRLDALKRSDRSDDLNFCRELEAGKMLGVLIAADADGGHHTLYAFSGQLGQGGFHFPGFVGPVFDYLEPNGYFKSKEADISRQNAEIERFEKGPLENIRSEWRNASESLNAEVTDYREKCRLSKLDRDARRKSGELDEAEEAALIRQSQFEKAELHRLKKKVAARLRPYVDALNDALSRLEAMKEQRRSDSEDLQKWLFSNFRLSNAKGQTRGLDEIFAETSMKVPPSGAGECCAPKLLHAAYLRKWRPLSIAEYWYGNPKSGEVRIHGSHYPACRGKCLPVLGWMLHGLSVEPPLSADFDGREVCDPEILFENRWFCVVDKPSGMLSVPGKGAASSVQRWLEGRYGEKSVKVVHRLDQDTSGLLIAAFGDLPFRTLQSLFAMRSVRKTYIAELEGDFKSRGIPQRGCIRLPISPDWLDRPRQKVDHKEGKYAATDYEFAGLRGERSRIVFHPLTGRTHQLRVHSASAEGLGIPIAGDRLYGKDSGCGAERLMLHAHRLEFTFPIDGEHYIFESPVPF